MLILIHDKIFKKFSHWTYEYLCTERKELSIISAVKRKAYNDDGNGVQHKVATIKV